MLRMRKKPRQISDFEIIDACRELSYKKNLTSADNQRWKQLNCDQWMMWMTFGEEKKN